MLLYEHLFCPNKKKILQKCFHTLRSFHRNRTNHFLEYSSSDLHSPIQAKRALPPGEIGTSIHMLMDTQGCYMLSGEHRESWGFAWMRDVTSTEHHLQSHVTARAFPAGVDASSCDQLYNSPLSKAPRKSSIQPLSHTPLGWQDLPASLT